jgi:putative membrane protein
MIAKILIGFIACLHLYILYMEMFSWERLEKKAFKGALPEDLFSKTTVMAANQGLYNGFLAAGLLWSLLISDEIWFKNIAYFFLVCIFIAGCYGAYSASKKIFFVQSLPSLIALLALYFS